MADDATSRGELLLRWVAFFTWGIVAFPFARHIAQHPESLGRLQMIAALGCIFGFFGFFLAGLRKLSRRLELLDLVAESALALGLLWLQPNSLAPILVIIVAAQAASCISLPLSVVWGTAQSLAMWAIFAASHEYKSSLEIALAYFAFQIFAVITAHTARSESEARRELERVNAELESATSLLSLNSRIAERTRISRDLHDILGHHLAALSINLEVASHLSEGKAKEQVEASQAIAKRLLSDVRSTVSRLRADESIDLHDALHTMVAAFPRPAIHLELEDELTSLDPLTAEVVLRCCQESITNAARHSGARNLRLSVRKHDDSIEIGAKDDGAVAPEADLALRSIRERVAARGGSVRAETPAGGGLSLSIVIPISPGGGA